MKNLVIVLTEENRSKNMDIYNFIHEAEKELERLDAKLVNDIQSKIEEAVKLHSAFNSFVDLVYNLNPKEAQDNKIKLERKPQESLLYAIYNLVESYKS